MLVTLPNPLTEESKKWHDSGLQGGLLPPESGCLSQQLANSHRPFQTMSTLQDFITLPS